MTTEHDHSEQLYKALLKVYDQRGMVKFMEVYKETYHALSSDLQDMLLMRVEEKQETKETVGLQKEGAGVGTVATVGDGGGGDGSFFTPTFGGDGKPKRKKKMKVAELKDFLMLSKSEEHERPVREGPRDTPRAVEFPSEMDTSVVDTQQDIMTQIEVLQDHGKDRRSRESAVSEAIEPMDDLLRKEMREIDETLDRINKEVYYGKVKTVLQKKETKPDILQKTDLFKSVNEKLEKNIFKQVQEE